ncbi:MAG: hypothetical protein ABSH48_13320 [Verrucomicrobiota bacterium]|jgi:hypothetical protein
MSKISTAKDAAEKALSIELGRTESLMRNAWKFAAAIVVVFGFQLRDLRTLVESPSTGVKVVCCLSFAALAASLVLACRSLQVRGEGHYPRGQKLWESLKPASVTEEAADEALVQMLLQSREQMARVNDTTARLQGWCGWMFLTGALLVAGSQLWDAFADWI